MKLHANCMREVLRYLQKTKLSLPVIPSFILHTMGYSQSYMDFLVLVLEEQLPSLFCSYCVKTSCGEVNIFSIPFSIPNALRRVWASFPNTETNIFMGVLKAKKPLVLLHNFRLL